MDNNPMTFATLSPAIAIMFGVAFFAALLAVWLLLQLRRPIGEARTYAYAWSR
ncbi:hypothetical protein [Stakelama flava]|uniref:hypothetical protein n=1 Tax=Stakelama flava TaxID=2860338 RepID=UPI001FE6595D|nr:hypothetical protein [Stakelama flava]